MCRLARPKSSAQSYQNLPYLHKQFINTGGSGGGGQMVHNFYQFAGILKLICSFTGRTWHFSHENIKIMIRVFRFIRFRTINGKIIIENVLFEQVKPSTNILCQFDIILIVDVFLSDRQDLCVKWLTVVFGSLAIFDCFTFLSVKHFFYRKNASH